MLLGCGRVVAKDFNYNYPVLLNAKATLKCMRQYGSTVVKVKL